MLKMIAGLVRPSEGRVLISGKDPHRDPHARAGLGALIEQPAYYPNLTGGENLKLFARIRGTPSTSVLTVVAEILGIVGLEDAAGQLAANYSLGMKQRLGIGIALIGDPEFLLLDEPQNGLDPIATASMRDLLTKLNALGHTLVISSHLLAEVEQLSSLIVVMSKGRVAFEGTLNHLQRHAETLEQAFFRLVAEGGAL